MSNGESTKSSSRSAAVPLSAAVTALTAVLLACFAGFAWYAHGRHGIDGVQAAAVGAFVCWAGAVMALVLAAWMRGPAGAVNGVLLGMFFRTGLPLAAGLYYQQRGGPLAEAGVFGMILCYYLVTLFAETLLSLWLVGPAKKVSEAS